MINVYATNKINPHVENPENQAREEGKSGVKGTNNGDEKGRIEIKKCLHRAGVGTGVLCQQHQKKKSKVVGKQGQKLKVNKKTTKNKDVPLEEKPIVYDESNKENDPNVWNNPLDSTWRSKPREIKVNVRKDPNPAKAHKLKRRSLNTPSRNKKTKQMLNDYLEKENKKFLNEWCLVAQDYDVNRDLSAFKVPRNVLANHAITEQIYTKMIDWMIEVLNIYDCGDQTFFRAVRVMNWYLGKISLKLRSEDIHLIGVTAMLIASKLEEVHAIPLPDFVSHIGHHQFTAAQWRRREIEIVETLSFDFYLEPTILTFIDTFFCDFKVNNQDTWASEDFSELINYAYQTAVYLAKVTLYFKEFNEWTCLLKAICCIVAGISIVVEWVDDLPKEIENDLDTWKAFLVNEYSFEFEEIEETGENIKAAYDKYQGNSNIWQNLNKFCGLSFN